MVLVPFTMILHLLFEVGAQFSFSLSFAISQLCEICFARAVIITGSHTKL